jgi:putative acetyltransferase
LSAITIRTEKSGDEPGIFAVNADAFPANDEARLVDALRAEGALAISLVADRGGAIIGHVAFSDMTVEIAGVAVRALGLAPVAVLTDCQRGGVGGALIRAGVVQARSAGVQILFVLGDPAYYGRFGFTSRDAQGFDCIYAGSYLQALLLDETLDLSQAGKADYAPAFASLEA